MGRPDRRLVALPRAPDPDVARARHADASSVSLRWRVMLLAMSMVAMVVVLMGRRRVRGGVPRALRRHRQPVAEPRPLLIESGSLAVDPGKAIEGTAYSDVNAMFVIPGRSIYTANQEGQTLPLGEPEKDVIAGRALMSLRTVNDQRVLAVHLPNGRLAADLQEPAPTGGASNGWARCS